MSIFLFNWEISVFLSIHIYISLPLWTFCFSSVFFSHKKEIFLENYSFLVSSQSQVQVKVKFKSKSKLSSSQSQAQVKVKVRFKSKSGSSQSQVQVKVKFSHSYPFQSIPAFKLIPIHFNFFQGGSTWILACFHLFFEE